MVFPEIENVLTPTSVEVFLMSHVEIKAAIALQRSFKDEKQTLSTDKASVLLCEHPCGTTLGSQSEPEIEHSSHAIYVNRGGGKIEHGTGQLAIYVTICLERLGVTPFQYRTCLEQIIESVCLELHLSEVERLPGIGVRCKAGLVAKTGIQIRENISSFGLYLNVSQIYSLGAKGIRDSSLMAASMKRIEIPEVKSLVIKQLERWLRCPSLSIHTTHPLLRRTMQRPSV